MKLEDIAAKAGVSRSTVSRVINGHPYVSAATRSKVESIIKQEGFIPNPAARTLVTQRTQVIGIVIPYPLLDVFAADEPHYFATIIRGISEITQQREYAMLLWLGSSHEEEDRFCERILKNRTMDGLIIIASVEADTQLVENLLDDQVPFVMIGRPMQHADHISYISVDNANAAQQVVQYLLGLGRRRIGTITGNRENVDAKDRLAGYRTALHRLGIPVDENLIVEGQFNREWGYLGMKQLLQHDIDALFAHNDSIAAGAIRAIVESGRRVPEDIAVVGFDDLPSAVQTTPRLTTIRQPVLHLASRASTLLLDLIEGKINGPGQILLPTQLIIRESCGGQPS
jgi:LacI family transcriptional regulator